jgi:hypothetical protein
MRVAVHQSDETVDRGLDARAADRQAAARGIVFGLGGLESALRQGRIVLRDLQIEHFLIAQRQPSQRRTVNLVGIATQRRDGFTAAVASGRRRYRGTQKILGQPKRAKQRMQKRRIILDLAALSSLSLSNAVSNGSSVGGVHRPWSRTVGSGNA